MFNLMSLLKYMVTPGSMVNVTPTGTVTSPVTYQGLELASNVVSSLSVPERFESVASL